VFDGSEDLMAALIVGLLSDTHVPHRMKRLPSELFDALEGVDVILHAGDVDDPAALEPLRKLAPVHAVRGNMHVLDFSDGGASLPTAVRLTLAGRRVVLTHGHRPGLLGVWFKGWDVVMQLSGRKDDGLFNRRVSRRLLQLYPEADIIVFGHSHRAHVEQLGHTLLVNPGAVCSAWGQPSTVARMQLGEGEPHVEIIALNASRSFS
jgi:hypothetical protein